MTVAGVLLLALQCVKLAAVLSAIRWILAHGTEFGTALGRAAADLPRQSYWRLLDRVHGRTVFPFGVLEYRLFRYFDRRGRLAGGIVAAGHRLFFDFTGLGLLVAAYLFLAGTPAFRQQVDGTVAGLAWACAGLAVLQLTAIYAEACVSYARIGSYGVGFHGAARYARNRRSAYFVEARTLAGAAIYSLLIGTMILYFSAGHGADFGDLEITATAPAGVVTDLLTCLYFAVVTFFTADTADPGNGPARLATAILVGQAACAFILALTTATIFIAPERKPAPPAPRRGRLAVSRKHRPRR